MRIEQYDGDEVLYLAVDPDGVWAKSEFPHDLITVDFNSDGDIIGIEVIGRLARLAREGVLQTVVSPDDPADVEAVEAIKKTLQPLLAGQSG
jgi:uncharacterized protein YuzE